MTPRFLNDDIERSAALLNLQPDELQALIWVKHKLVVGHILYAPHNRDEGPKVAFNMGSYSHGTAVCIASWMEVRLGRRVYGAVAGMQRLFHPDPRIYRDVVLGSITTAQAVRAMDECLDGNKYACWNAALSEPAPYVPLVPEVSETQCRDQEG